MYNPYIKDNKSNNKNKEMMNKDANNEPDRNSEPPLRINSSFV